ncbi:hypothetical protein AB0C15_16120 [Micromonospora sp. NPDC048835]|uniref:hypothetical protein n=1 Tax=Micromonospora sp. NPDC048835 TaxID=3155147 RepID=UPI0033C6E66D
MRPIRSGQLGYTVDPAVYPLPSKAHRPPRRQAILHECHGAAEDIDLALRRRIEGSFA